MKQLTLVLLTAVLLVTGCKQAQGVWNEERFTPTNWLVVDNYQYVYVVHGHRCGEVWTRRVDHKVITFGENGIGELGEYDSESEAKGVVEKACD